MAGVLNVIADRFESVKVREVDELSDTEPKFIGVEEPGWRVTFPFAPA